MQIDIVTRSFPLTDAIRAYVKRRLDYSLGSRYGRLKCVVVRLSDTNGPRGGSDKCCRIQVVVAGQADLVVEATEPDLYAAIDRSADRVSRSLVRRLDRNRQFTRPRMGAALAVRDEPGECLY